jgi:beta-galactosidase
MLTWGKGQVWVNGKNLGRYWSIGPQQTLYLPGVWLVKGKNVITLFEEIAPPQPRTIRFANTPSLNDVRLN